MADIFNRRNRDQKRTSKRTGTRALIHITSSSICHLVLMCNQQKSSCPCYETHGNKFLPDLCHALFTSMLAAYNGRKSCHPSSSHAYYCSAGGSEQEVSMVLLSPLHPTHKSEEVTLVSTAQLELHFLPETNRKEVD